MATETEIRFYQLWDDLGAMERYDTPYKLWNALKEYYSEPHRFYHTLDHIEFGLTQFDLLEEYPPWLEFAYFYHDIVYNIGSKYNEGQSAYMARDALRQGEVSAEEIDLVVSAIVATEHKNPPIITLPNQVICDIDLATLGLPRDEFAKYQMKVRAEYVDVPTSKFWPAHRNILKEFYDRPQIYYTDFFQERYEQQARENIAWTLDITSG